MNAPFALFVALLSAGPAADVPAVDDDSVYPAALSGRFDVVLRAQTPGPVLSGPTFGAPSAAAPSPVVSGPLPTTTMYQPSGTILGQSPGGYPPGGYAPFGVAPPTTPYTYDPSYVPGGALQENRWGFYTGYDNVILRPFFNRNVGAQQRTAGGANIDNDKIDWGFTYSPRVWIGLIEPNNTGMQVRYWQFDNGEEDGSGAGAARQSLDLHVIDAEKQWHFSNRGLAMSVGAGLRYASLDTKLTTQFSAAGVFPAGSITYDRNFHGFGPTLSISGRKRVNNTNWALFASARLSGLYGDSSAAVVDPNDALAINPVAPGNPNAFYQSGQDLIGVTDLQFGVDWSAPVWAQTHFFVRIAGEGQLWFGGGLPTAPGIDGVLDNDNLGFFGFTVGTGLTF